MSQFLRACADTDPATKRFSAATPKLLKAIFRNHGDSWSTLSMYAHAADLMLGAFFFAMRGCEYVHTPRPGKTKQVAVQDIHFRDRQRHVIPHGHPLLSSLASSVTITFRDQKNRHKYESRTQYRSGHRFLCPVARWIAVVRRIRCMFPVAARGDTPLPVSSFLPSPLHRSSPQLSTITSEFTLLILRSTCRAAGGFSTFGYNPLDLGNPSLRSGAAMSLFLMNHSPARIMILGRWSSDAFLAYIRPQVIEWTNNLSRDMTQVNHFMDASKVDRLAPDEPANRRDPRSYHGPQTHAAMPAFNLFH